MKIDIAKNNESISRAAKHHKEKLNEKIHVWDENYVSIGLYNKISSNPLKMINRI